MDIIDTILQGDALETLRTLPDGCAQCCISSPPYDIAILATNRANHQYGGMIGSERSQSMVTSNCRVCGREIKRNGAKAATFCSLKCKAQWQQSQKSVTREWLEQKYIAEGLSTYQIGKIVGRNPKRVWEWLRGYSIPLRERAWDTVLDPDCPYHQAEWLREQYVGQGRSAAEIAAQFGVTEGTIAYFLQRFAIPARTISEARALKYWGSHGAANPMHGRNGHSNPNWRGGFTPERQAFYSSLEWVQAVKVVWARDKATCRRCGMKPNGRSQMHIHHIVPFAVKELRAEPHNLALVCVACHQWIHSRLNVNREFIGSREEGGGAK